MNLVIFIEQLLKQQNKTWAELSEYLGSTDIDATRMRLLIGVYTDTTLNNLAGFFNLGFTDFKEL